MKGLDWQLIQLPLAAGRNDRVDERALQPPELAQAIDVQFDELGGLQTRKPCAALGSSIAGGGTIANARRHYANGSEHVLFTNTAIYSWNDQLDRWVFRATHLAVALDEKTVYATPGDQYDCDRAELSGIVYHAWTDTNKVYVAATDKSSGAVILAPTAVGGTGTRPRLVALATRVLLFWHAGTDGAPGNILGLAIDPTVTDPATLSTQLTTPSSTTILAAANSGSYFDVTRIIGTDTAIFVARRAVTTSYEMAKVTAAMAVTSSTKALICDGPIAVSSDPTGATVQVIRAHGTLIEGDRITVSSLATAASGQSVGSVAGTPVSQIACAHRSVQDSGAYRCYAFWTASESASTNAWTSKYNYVDTGGTIGSEANFIRLLGIGSRAFDYGGRVFVWGVFAQDSSFSGGGAPFFRAALQNTYFLYRDDATLHAKAAATRGGGLAPSVGRLPGVALTSGTTIYSWCATERRIISIGSAGVQTSFDMRAPRDVTFEFDSNAARRCVRLGETLYIAGAEVLQYDSIGVFEVGYHVYPWYFGALDAGGVAGNLANGTYTYKVTWRWENGRGEQDRSTTATSGQVTITGGPHGAQIPSWGPLYHTHKTTARPVSVEVWRTGVNPGEGAPFFLVTAKDPASLTNPNRYVPNDPTASNLPTFNDALADSDATTKETNPENGDVLENLAPPGAKIIAATDTRVFLGGVAGDPDRIWYSKLRQVGEVASFHDALTFDVPRDGGAITGIAFQNGECVVFREFATYLFPGEGFDNTGHGTNYGPPQILSYDIGCRDTDSIVVTPEGIAFQSSKGKQLLTRGWTLEPIGLGVSDYDSETVVAAHVVTAQHQIRWLTASRMLVFDYLAKQWAEWTITGGVHAAVWQGTYHYLTSTGPYAEQATYSSTGYGQDVELAWIKPNDLQGAAAVRKLLVTGEHRSYHYLRTRIAYDYDTTWVDDGYWQANSSAGKPLQREIRPSRQKIQAIKLRLTAVGDATQATFVTSTDVSLIVTSDNPLAHWSATFGARALGSLGNGIHLSVHGDLIAGSTPSLELRDNQYATGSGDGTVWVAEAGTVGIRLVLPPDATFPISTIENAISDYSELLKVVSFHPYYPASIMASDVGFYLGPTAGGAFAAPTGESLKLTGLGLEVGVEPRLFKRFPRSGGGV